MYLFIMHISLRCRSTYYFVFVVKKNKNRSYNTLHIYIIYIIQHVIILIDKLINCYAECDFVISRHLFKGSDIQHK